MKKWLSTLARRILGKPSLEDYKKRGLQAADDLRCISMPYFGSEPYLISIGRHVTIASNVIFITHDGATWVFRDKPEYRNVIKYGRITISENCFIGRSVMIMPGVSIGPNSVVAAGAVVTKSIPSGEVWGGNPAKYICTTEEYAQKSLERTPQYDNDKYRTDKKRELLRLFPYPL